MRSFGYLGSIASSAVIGIVFRQCVSDTGTVVIAIIMIGASITLLHFLSPLMKSLRLPKLR